MPATIIDAHTHIWDLELTPQPWIEGDAEPALKRSFSLGDLEAVARPVGVGQALIVQSVNEALETERLLRDTESEPFVAGVIGWADFSSADSESAIERLLASPGGGRLRGLRHVFAHREAEQWMHAGCVNATLRSLARLRLSFDLLLREHELPLALWLARRYPDVTFVLDHLAKPNVRRGSFDRWRQDLLALAEAPNVYAKCSGLPAEADWREWSAPTIAPYFETALDAFTPERLIFATDWPVCTVAGSYTTVFEAQVSLCAELSPTERALVLGGAARRAYRLDVGLGSRTPGEVGGAP